MTRDLNDAVPTLADALRAAKTEYESQHPGHVIIWLCVYRSLAEQWNLFIQGRHLQGGAWVENDPVHHVGIVTNFDGLHAFSNHNHRPARAVDFGVVVDGVLTWDLHQGYTDFGNLCEDKYGLHYGGNWVKRGVSKWNDNDHVELPKETA